MPYTPATGFLLPVAFLDGVALGPREALVIAAEWGLEDTEERPTRLLHFKDGSVAYLDVAQNIVSLCRIGDGEGGAVLALTRTDSALIVWPEPGPLERVGRRSGSSLNRLHATADLQFACGMFGQVYRRNRGSWSPIDAGLYNPTPSVDADQLRDLGGASEGRLVTVGLFGRAYEYDGRTWSPISLPTNAHLEQAVCDASGAIWICGNDGMLFRGAGEEWEAFETGTRTTFWGMAPFRGRLYLAGMNGIWALDEATSVAEPIAMKVGLDREPTTYSLDASGTDLWSFGLYDVLRFDGSRWERAPYPGNE